MERGRERTSQKTTELSVSAKATTRCKWRWKRKYIVYVSSRRINAHAEIGARRRADGAAKPSITCLINNYTGESRDARRRLHQLRLEPAKD